jgi:N utilization substance protein A
MKKVLDIDALRLARVFQQVSGVGIRDCISGDILVFVVNPGEIGRAVGKGGANVRALEKKFKKKVKVIEYSDDLEQFIKNVVSPYEIAEFFQSDDVVVLSAKDLKTRGMLIGRNASHLRFYESIIKRFFPVKELKVK